MNKQSIIHPICLISGMVVWFGGMGHSITDKYLIFRCLKFCTITLEWNGLLYMNTNHTIPVKVLIINVYSGMVN